MDDLSTGRRSTAAWMGRQDTFSERLTRAIERSDRTLAHVEITQARLETLLARMIQTEDNGREA